MNMLLNEEEMQMPGVGRNQVFLLLPANLTPHPARISARGLLGSAVVAVAIEKMAKSL
jgi:hypothetical protein